MNKTTWTIIGGAAAVALSPVAAFGVASLSDRGVSGAPLAGDGIVVRAAAATTGPDAGSGTAADHPSGDPTGSQTVSAPSPISPLTARTPASPPTPSASPNTANTPNTPNSPISPRSPATP